MLFQVTIPIASNIGSSAPLELGPYFSNIVGAALTIAAIATLIYLVMGGISWITAGGDEKKIEKSRGQITGAIIGLAIVAVSWALFLILDTFLGIGITSNTGSGGGGGGTGVASCPCINNKCASVGQVSQLTSSTDCRICTSGGWTQSGAPATCASPITCGACP